MAPLLPTRSDDASGGLQSTVLRLLLLLMLMLLMMMMLLLLFEHEAAYRGAQLLHLLLQAVGSILSAGVEALKIRNAVGQHRDDSAPALEVGLVGA